MARNLALPHQLAAGSVEVPGGDLDQPFERPVLASERFRYVGEPYGVVIAETAGQAQDAAERIWADVEPLPVVIDAESATATDAPLLFPETGTNVATRFEHHWDDDVLAVRRSSCGGGSSTSALHRPHGDENGSPWCPTATATRCGCRRRCPLTCVAIWWTSSTCRARNSA
jgi:hypothetical protein